LEREALTEKKNPDSLCGVWEESGSMLLVRRKERNRFLPSLWKKRVLGRTGSGGGTVWSLFSGLGGLGS